MRQNCAIEKSQAVKNIEYQNKPGEKGKRVQPTDISIWRTTNLSTQTQTRAFCLRETIYMGQLDPFIKSVSCVCSRKCYRQWTVWVPAHIVSHYYGGAGEQPEVRNSQFCGKEASTHFPNVIQHFSSHFCCNYLISLITDKWHGNSAITWTLLYTLFLGEFPINHADTCFLWHFCKALHQSPADTL